MGEKILAFEFDVTADLEYGDDDFGCPLLVLTDQ
jgi:hypothetical protein